MITPPTAVRPRLDTERLLALRASAVPLLLYAVIGIELMVLIAWLPDTLRAWWSASDVGDFRGFYANSAASEPAGLYSPAMAFLLKPLTWLEIGTAFRIYTGVNVAAMLGVAYLAQRGVRSLEARTAVALAVIALPLAQWSLRVGHFPMILALFALGGFLLADRRPVVAGVLFALLALKPQYLPVPLLYLLWTRNRPALLGAGGTLLAMSVAGIVVVGIEPFVTQLRQLANTGLDQGGTYLPAQQAWQYSWQGFLISAGVEPNPLLTVDLLVLSLGAVILTWAKATPSVAKVAAALGMLLLAPWSTFYNWSIIAVALALLLRSDLRPRALIPTLLGLGALAVGLTMQATPYPSPNLLIGGTQGLYWLPPFALLTVFLLALAGRRRAEPAGEAGAPPPTRIGLPAWSALRPQAVTRRLPRLALGAAALMIAIGSGYALSAYVSQNGPFKPSESLFGRQTVLAALPEDFPILVGATIEDAGRGTLLPYRLSWTTAQPASEVAGLFRRALNDGSWEIVLANGGDDGLQLRTIRLAPNGEIELFGDVQIAREGEGSAIQLEFTLLPSSRVPGFDQWLADRDAEAAD